MLNRITGSKSEKIKVMKTGRKITHGKWGSKEWNSWDHMKRRCSNLNDQNYPNYGGRGITVCERWLKFENFYADMGDAPTKAHSLDRIDVNGNYEPTNCRWATNKEQQNNRTDNKILTIDGESKTVSQWAEFTGLPISTIWSRINNGITGTGLFAPNCDRMGENNSRAIFKNTERFDIVKMYSSGITQAVIARKYNVVVGTIKSVVRSELKKARNDA
jgi:hypothetical protein